MITDNPVTVTEMANQIEKLVLEILAQSPEGSKEHQFAALIVMDVMAIQGREAERKGKFAKKGKA